MSVCGPNRLYLTHDWPARNSVSDGYALWCHAAFHNDAAQRFGDAPAGTVLFGNRIGETGTADGSRGPVCNQGDGLATKTISMTTAVRDSQTLKRA